MAIRSEPFSGPTYKVILLGDPGVGKTTLFLRLQRGSFVDTEAQSTIGVDYTEKDFTFGDTTVRMFLHDTGGGERFRTLTSNFFRNAHAVILVYSVEDAFTFDNLTLWVEECHNNLGPEFENLVWVLVGNKADQPRADTISDERVMDFCKQIHAKYSYETSAKTGENVEQMFQTVAKVVHAAHGDGKSAQPKPTATKLTSAATPSKRKGDCDC